MDTLSKRIMKIAADVENGSNKKQSYSNMQDALSEFKKAYYKVLDAWDDTINNELWFSGKMKAENYPFFTKSFDELGIDDFCDKFEIALEELQEEAQ